MMAKVLRSICDRCNDGENAQEVDAFHTHRITVDGKTVDLDLCGRHDGDFQANTSLWLESGVPIKSHQKAANTMAVQRTPADNWLPCGMCDGGSTTNGGLVQHYRQQHRILKRAFLHDNGELECRVCHEMIADQHTLSSHWAEKQHLPIPLPGLTHT